MKTEQALINIRDFKPDHCRGDIGIQMTIQLDNIYEIIDEIKDLLE